jgi:hypothetical protein
MGFATPYAGTTLPTVLGTATTFSLGQDALFWQNMIAKKRAIGDTITGMNAAPTTYAGNRQSPFYLHEAFDYNVTPAGVIVSVTTNGLMTGAATAFITDLREGDVVNFLQGGGGGDYRSFTVVKVWNNTLAQVINLTGGTLSGAGMNVPFTVLRESQTTLPLMNNPEFYMTGADLNAQEHNAAMSLLEAEASLRSRQITADVENGVGDYAQTMTEEQLGLDVFADVATAKAELQKSVAAANTAIASATAVITAAAPANIAATIATFVQPLIDALVSQRDADLLALQRSYSIANGFFNTNVGNRVAELMNKYAVQIASLEADAGFKALQMFTSQAVQAIDMLMKFENGPLRDRVMAQELRLKAMEVGTRMYLASDKALQERWALLYGSATDAVKRDYTNDTLLWGSREDAMRFNAELEMAYMGAFNAGVGKGVDAAGVAKGLLGTAVIAGGAIAALKTGGTIGTETMGAGAKMFN